MSYTKISICNLALAALGAAQIRSFTEDNKRARMCDVFYTSAKDYLLSKFDWPFARGYAELTQVDTTLMTIPENYYVYSLPPDCKVPRTIQERGSKHPWYVQGRHLYCKISDDVYLYYTKEVQDSALFSDTFVDLLYLRLAMQMGPAITSDKKLVGELREQYRMAQYDNWESDANIGNSYRDYDEDPDNDTFVSPGGGPVNPDPNVGRTWNT